MKKEKMNKSRSKLDMLQDLMAEILDIQKENSRDTTVLKRVEDIIQESSNLVENSESTSELIIDAKILQTGSQYVNSNVISFDTDLLSFDEVLYKKGLLSFIQNNFNPVMCESPWECLVPLTYHLYKRCISTTSMVGLLHFSVPKKDKLKQKRTKTILKPKVTILSSKAPDKNQEATSDNIYEHIFKSLLACYKNNNKKPIPFIDFIIDPMSYWQSVENIFHFSFLIHDGSVNMCLNDDGLPVVAPVLKKDITDMSLKKNNNHFCFALSKEDWKKCIEKFGIYSAKIKYSGKS